MDPLGITKGKIGSTKQDNEWWGLLKITHLTVNSSVFCGRHAMMSQNIKCNDACKWKTKITFNCAVKYYVRLLKTHKFDS